MHKDGSARLLFISAPTSHSHQHIQLLCLITQTPSISTLVKMMFISKFYLNEVCVCVCVKKCCCPRCWNTPQQHWSCVEQKNRNLIMSKLIQLPSVMVLTERSVKAFSCDYFFQLWAIHVPLPQVPKHGAVRVRSRAPQTAQLHSNCNHSFW